MSTTKKCNAQSCWQPDPAALQSSRSLRQKTLQVACQKMETSEISSTTNYKAFLATRLLFGKTLLDLLKLKNEMTDTYDCWIDLGSKSLERYARDGGPDKEHFEAVGQPLRLLPSSTNIPQWFHADMAAEKAQKKLTKKLVLTAGSTNFAHHIAKLGAVYPRFYEAKPSNLNVLKARLKQTRTELANVTEDEVQRFRVLCEEAVNEATATPLFDKLLGSSDGFCSARQLDMSKLKKLDNMIASCKPDICDGVPWLRLNDEIEEQVKQYIVPNELSDTPCLPTWFMEAKGPSRSPKKAKNQAMQAGILGERGVFQLRSKFDPSHAMDGESHVITATLISQTQNVDVYCMHRASDGRYIMTELISLKISDLNSYKTAVTWLRNGREWAKDVRDSLLPPVTRVARLDMRSDHPGEQIGGRTGSGKRGMMQGKQGLTDRSDATVSTEVEDSASDGEVTELVAREAGLDDGFSDHEEQINNGEVVEKQEKTSKQSKAKSMQERKKRTLESDGAASTELRSSVDAPRTERPVEQIMMTTQLDERASSAEEQTHRRKRRALQPDVTTARTAKRVRRTESATGLRGGGEGEAEMEADVENAEVDESSLAPRRGRGRPKGSKNKKSKRY